MLSKTKLRASLLGLGLILGILTSTVAAQPAAPNLQQNGKFRRIEQPLSLKVGVTLGGIALIGLELWWFQFSKTKAQQAEDHQGVQEINITVDGGYSPSRIMLLAGQPARLNFFRKDPNSCLEKVLLPDFHKSVDLHLNQTTVVELSPQEAGTYIFHCGMNMFRGTLDVQDRG